MRLLLLELVGRVRLSRSVAGVATRRERRSLVLLAAVPVLLLAFASACSGGTEPQEASASGNSQSTSGEVSQPVDETPPTEVSADDYSPSLFDESSITIDNEWWPLEPGTRFFWRGWTVEEGERVAHRIVFTVTDLTKEIDGVHTVVGWDRDFSRGALVEAELIFLAQDKGGNVWHFGQYSETWEDEELVGGQSWLVGHLDGAKAGILMKADPQLGSPPYSQGFAPPPFFWDDVGQVYKMGQETCVPAGCYSDVLVIDESEPTKPGAHQIKYYARGVGNIRTGWRGKDADREVLVLQRVEQLDSEALARAREQALELETRAAMYGSTPPAAQRSD